MCSLTARRHVSKRAVHRTSIPWVCSADLRRLASFGVGGAAAALTPQRFDAVIADVLSRLYTFVSPHTADRIVTGDRRDLRPWSGRRRRHLDDEHGVVHVLAADVETQLPGG